MECSFSAFGYEHLVTTFTRLDIACGMLYGKDGRNRSRQTQAAETLEEAKTRIKSHKNGYVQDAYSVLHTWGQSHEVPLVSQAKQDFLPLLMHFRML